MHCAFNGLTLLWYNMYTAFQRSFGAYFLYGPRAVYLAFVVSDAFDL